MRTSGGAPQQEAGRIYHGASESPREKTYGHWFWEVGGGGLYYPMVKIKPTPKGSGQLLRAALLYMCDILRQAQAARDRYTQPV